MTTAPPVPHDHIVSTEFEGGEGVLVDLNSKQYYQLNETAMLVWRCLENRQSLEAIVAEMTTVYDVPPEQAASKIEKVFEEFQSRNLVGA
jgi:galactose-1-phosphate uridylyltransferase